MPKAWKILFLNPGLLGLASCWCWPLLAADCPSCSALCTNGSGLFACVRLRSYCVRVRSPTRFGQNSVRSGCAGRDGRRDETKKRTKRKKKRIVDGYKCLCQLLHGMRKCIRLICTSKWQTEERKPHLFVTLFVFAIGQTGSRTTSGRALLVAQQRLYHSCLAHQFQCLQK